MTELKRHDSQRGWFAYELYNRMGQREDIWVVSIDLGFGMFDAIRRDYPDRFLNVGAAEQAGVGIAVGLAEEGKVPICYSITPFLLYRAFETIRNYVNKEGVPVKLVGSGRDRDYRHDGFSHWSCEERRIMDVFRNITARWPATKEEIPALVGEMLETSGPFYVNLRR